MSSSKYRRLAGLLLLLTLLVQTTGTALAMHPLPEPRGERSLADPDAQGYIRLPDIPHLYEVVSGDRYGSEATVNLVIGTALNLTDSAYWNRSRARLHIGALNAPCSQRGPRQHVDGRDVDLIVRTGATPPNEDAMAVVVWALLETGQVESIGHNLSDWFDNDLKIIAQQVGARADNIGIHRHQGDAHVLSVRARTPAGPHAVCHDRP